jgi:hypothetical protein
MVGPACTNSGAATGDDESAPLRSRRGLAARSRGGDAVRMPRSPLAAALATLLALTSAVLTPASAAACSCAWRDVGAARDQATHVFEGVLVSAAGGASEAATQAVFEVHRVWKGAVTRSFAVQARVGIVMCPPHLEVGQRYIIYTSGPANAPRVESCARYAAGESLATERTALGAPTQTYAARSPARPNP